MRESKEFALTAVGDINTYALFAELAGNLLNGRGRTGIIVPTGIATDDTCKDFFGHISQKQMLVSLFDFENRNYLFPSLHTKTKFCLLTLSKTPIAVASYCFLSTKVQDLLDPIQIFPMSASDLRLMNPNTQTCPLFRTRSDAELTKKIYRAVPIFVNEVEDSNPWQIQFCAMFHMSNDSELFASSDGDTLLPLYEAKMFWHFDHRWATFEDGSIRECTAEEKVNPTFSVTPKYWVPEKRGVRSIG